MYLSYGNIAWRNILTQQLETVQRLQRKITRIITFLKFKEYTDPLFKELSILVYHHLPKTFFCPLTLTNSEQELTYKTLSNWNIKEFQYGIIWQRRKNLKN